MLTFLRRIFGNGEKIVIGNKICIGIMLFFYLMPIFVLWESCGHQDVELSKKNELSKLKDDLSNLKADSETAAIQEEIKALQVRLNKVNQKYEPYHAELLKRKKVEEERARKAEAEARESRRKKEAIAKQAEFEKQLKMLDRYPSVEDIAVYFATPNLMKRELMGKIVVIHGKVEEISDSTHVKTLFMSGWFTADGDVHKGSFLFENDSFNFTAGCRVGDYVLVKGTCGMVKGKDSFLSGAMVVFRMAKIHYNYGRLKR